MRWLWLIPGIVLGFMAGGVVGSAFVFAECTDTGYDYDSCIIFAFALAIIGAGIGAVVSALLLAISLAKRSWAVLAMIMGITLGLFIGGIVGIAFTEDLDKSSRPSSVTPYVGLLSGGVLGMGGGGLLFFLARRVPPMNLELFDDEAERQQ